MLYLDHHSTTPCAPEVVTAMLPYFTEVFGNPSSKSHAPGRAAAMAIEDARRKLATLLSADPRELVFTSGATESLNLALRGLVMSYPDRRRIAVSAFEHRAVLDTAHDLARSHHLELVLVPPNPNGLVTPAALTRALDGRPALLVAIMAANNEVGTIQPVAALAEVAHQHDAFFVCDAVQAVGRIPFAPGELGVDVAALSAHKLYGPKGVGALWLRSMRSTRPASTTDTPGPALPVPTLSPQVTGGGQERELRPGTHNVPGIVGLGRAAELAHERLAADMAHLNGLREALLAALHENLTARDVRPDLMRVTCDTPTPVCHFDADVSTSPPRLPGSLHVTFAGLEGFRLIAALSNDLAVSSGSACSSESRESSHVLTSLSLPEDRRFAALRIGLGRHQTTADMRFAAERIATEVAKLTPAATRHAPR